MTLDELLDKLIVEVVELNNELIEINRAVDKLESSSNLFKENIIDELHNMVETISQYLERK